MSRRRPGFFRGLRRAIQGDDFGYQRHPLEWVRDVLTLPFRFVSAFMAFMVMAWPTSRNGGAFLKSLPAILAIALFGVVIWASFYLGNLRARVNKSKNNMQFHLVNSVDNPEYAEMFAKRWVMFQPESEEAKYQLAVCSELAGNDIVADDLYGFLTTFEDQNGNGELDPGEDANGDGELNWGYGKAHIRLAERLLKSSEADQPNTAELEQAERRLKIALKAEDNETIILGNSVLASVYEKLGEKKKAVESLEQMLALPMTSLLQLQAIPRRLRIKLDLLKEQEDRLSNLTGEELRRETRSVQRQRELIESATRNQIDDSKLLAKRLNRIEVWGILVNSAGLIDDFGLARDLIQRAGENADDDLRRQLTILSSQVYLTVANTVEDLKEEAGYKKYLGSHCLAVDAHAQNGQAIDGILDLLAERDSQQEEWTRAMQATARSRFMIEIVLGLVEFSGKRFNAAKDHWRSASQISPDKSSLVIANFVEKIVTRADGAIYDLNEVFALATELFPGNPKLLVSEGIYRLRRKQLTQAIVLMERAVEQLPNYLLARHGLVECYRKTGDADKQAEHEKAIESIYAQYSPIDRERIRQNFTREFILGETEPGAGSTDEL